MKYDFKKIIKKVVLLLGVTLFLALPSQAKRVALVIGNDNYASVGKLEKAGNDATAMAKELRAAGFTVQLQKDLNYRSMVKVIESFANTITGGDEVVVFYAGHGVQIKNGSYLLPTDIETNSEKEVEKTAYELLALTDMISDAKPAFSLVMVDACRDNPLKSSGRSVGNSRGLSAIEPPKGQIVVYSASRGQQALDKLNEKDSNPNGVFTREFISRMKKPGVKIEDLMREVQDAVETLAKTVNHEQRPAVYNEARGNFYFFGPTTVQVAPSASPVFELTPSQREEKFWDDAKLAGNKEAFEAYLDGYPKGRFVNLAKAYIARLTIAVPQTDPLLTLSVPSNITEPKPGSNLKVWISDPLNPSVGLKNGGLFITPDTTTKTWKYYGPTTDGSMTLSLADGAYLLDTVEPGGKGDGSTVYAKKKYNLTVLNGVVNIKDARLDPSGYFILTLQTVATLKDCEYCPEMVVIPLGRFIMGAQPGEEEREKLPDRFRNRSQPQREVSVSTFVMARHEVTVGQYRSFVTETNRSASDGCLVWTGNKYETDLSKNWRNPGFTQTDSHPVTCVSWDDATAYTQWLKQKTGKDYKLPSEVQWEYAARAGTTTSRFWGDDGNMSCSYANGADLNYVNGADLKAKTEVLGASSRVVANCDDRYAYTAPVGFYRANAFGLHDMLGNVWEWTQDCWNEDYVGAPNDSSGWTKGDCSRRVLRGGSWVNSPMDLRSAIRDKGKSSLRNHFRGFRVVRAP